MNQNPYEASIKINPVLKTRPTRWLVTTGCTMLELAMVCFFATMAIMIRAFNTIANSNSTPKPAELAIIIGWSVFPLIAVILIGMFGLVFLLIGLLIRQPVNKE